MLLQRLAKKLFGASVPLEAYHYNFWKQRELRERAAWVADFTFEPRLDKPEWAVFDHHVTDAMPKFARLIHDVNKSAGLICYEFCVQSGMASPALDRLVHLNNVADLFLEDDPDFVVATDYANLVKIYQFWNLHALIGGEIGTAAGPSAAGGDGRQAPRLKTRSASSGAKKTSRKSARPSVTWTPSSATTIWSSTNCWRRRTTKYPVLVTLFRRGNLIFASFRSRNGEALKMAEKFQGGGHANAAGAILPKSIRNIPDAVEYLRQILNPPRGYAAEQSGKSVRGN